MLVARSTASLRLPGVRGLFMNHRFAMWSLGTSTRDGCVTAAELLAEDRQQQLELAARNPTASPCGRLLLPLAAAPSSADQLRRQQLWVDGVTRTEECWARMMAQPQMGFMALAVFNQQPKTAKLPPRVTHVPGRIGSRLLLANAFVNVWDFHVPPLSSCELHEHLHPYVFINRTTCQTQGLDAELQPAGPATTFNARDFRYVEVAGDATAPSCIHAFQNPGQDAVQQYIVEFVA
ncbi:hypothetical protein BBJ28_00012993 [Nothophytophthora sp. Chile5]|nr:hypothetical protein BBJ28_00012993 [Nothophytophthora sp. Chile5]